MERVFQCPQCEKGFKELRTLRLHLKIHNAEYPERCLVCQKVFRTKWQLKQHQMDHGGERPYPCPECSFTCKTKQQLNEHRRKHSGEKAYCCALCGTRFTYRNGLIKHTKLNRCPKKIITADGETIIKKRSRVVSKQSPLQGPSPPKRPLLGSNCPPPTRAIPPAPVLNLQMSVAVAEAVNNVISASKGGGKECLDERIMEVLRRNSAPPRSEVSPEKILSDPLPSPVRRGSPIIDTQLQMEDIIQCPRSEDIADHGGGPTFNLALLDDSSSCLVSTTCTLPTQTITTKAHPSSVASSSMTTTSTSSTVIAHNGVLPPNTINELSAATGLPSSEITSWAASLPSGALVKVTHHYNTSIEPAPEHSQEDSLPSLPPQPQVEAVTGGALKNSSVGLLSYPEVFAVDPNEVLQKSQSKSTLLSSRSTCLSETSLEDFIDLDYGGLIKEEPLSPTGSDSGLSNNSYYINNSFDLDDSLSVLNENDFSSMKSIVEQTFKDGREIMDVISAV